MLAAMLGVEGADAAFALRLYDARSEGVHGRPVALVAGWTDDAIRDSRLALHLLRRAVRRLIEHEEFSQHFVDKRAIDRLFGRETVPDFS
jgi:hypothetical protein